MHIKRLLEATKVRLRGWIYGIGRAILLIGVGAVIGLLALQVPVALSLGILARM
ncbi:MAG TPA: hypothetical protein V6D35_19435 [Candidatus Sericytochromatia bacterium]